MKVEENIKTLISTFFGAPDFYL